MAKQISSAAGQVHTGMYSYRTRIEGADNLIFTRSLPSLGTFDLEGLLPMHPNILNPLTSPSTPQSGAEKQRPRPRWYEVSSRCEHARDASRT